LVQYHAVPPARQLQWGHRSHLLNEFLVLNIHLHPLDWGLSQNRGLIWDHRLRFEARRIVNSQWHLVQSSDGRACLLSCHSWLIGGYCCSCLMLTTSTTSFCGPHGFSLFLWFHFGSSILLEQTCMGIVQFAHFI